MATGKKSEGAPQAPPPTVLKMFLMKHVEEFSEKIEVAEFLLGRPRYAARAARDALAEAVKDPARALTEDERNHPIRYIQPTLRMLKELDDILGPAVKHYYEVILEDLFDTPIDYTW